MRKYFLTLSACLLLVPNWVTAQQSYSFGVVPQQMTSQSIKAWNPLLQHLSELVGVKLNFATASSIPAFEKNVENGVYDFAYMNPYHYVTYHTLSNYNAFAKEQRKKIKGIIVVRKDSSIQNLIALNHKTLAFPSPNAFAATLITQADLRAHKVQFKPKYVRSHDAVYYNVVNKEYPAGGGILRTFNALNPQLRSQLKILHTSKGYTPHTFAAHPRVPKDIVNKVLAALKRHHSDVKSESHLKRLHFKRIMSAKDSDWDDVRQLNIK